MFAYDIAIYFDSVLMVFVTVRFRNAEVGFRNCLNLKLLLFKYLHQGISRNTVSRSSSKPGSMFVVTMSPIVNNREAW